MPAIAASGQLHAVGWGLAFSLVPYRSMASGNIDRCLHVRSHCATPHIACRCQTPACRFLTLFSWVLCTNRTFSCVEGCEKCVLRPAGCGNSWHCVLYASWSGSCISLLSCSSLTVTPAHRAWCDSIQPPNSMVLCYEEVRGSLEHCHGLFATLWFSCGCYVVQDLIPGCAPPTFENFCSLHVV